MKKRFTEGQIIGFLREAETGLPVAELCRRHGLSEASYYLNRPVFELTPRSWTNFKRFHEGVLNRPGFHGGRLV